MSNSAWLDKLEWEHSKEWTKVEPEIWRLNDTSASVSPRRDTLAGTVQVYGNLTRVIVWNAGHFVPAPAGNPQAAYEMIDRSVSELSAREVTDILRHINNVALTTKNPDEVSYQKSMSSHSLPSHAIADR